MREDKGGVYVIGALNSSENILTSLRSNFSIELFSSFSFLAISRNFSRVVSALLWRWESVEFVGVIMSVDAMLRVDAVLLVGVMMSGDALLLVDAVLPLDAILFCVLFSSSKFSYFGFVVRVLGESW